MSNISDSNISIVNNVISASGGSVELYEHNIYIKNNGTNKIFITLKILMTTNTPFTHSLLYDFLKNNHFWGDWDASGVYSVSGSWYSSSIRVAHGLFVYPEGDNDIHIASGANQYLTMYFTSTGSTTIMDTIRQIL